MKLIVGLGNIGDKYHETRHNVGFMAIDQYAKNNNLEFKTDMKLKARYLKTKLYGEDVILLKPTTYMNSSGDSISLVSKYFKVDIKDILVIYDDLDMEVGKIRLRDKGSSGGHNGIKSIISQLHTQEFKRLKVGILNQYKKDTISFVLGKFMKDEQIDVLNAIDKSCLIIDEFIKGTKFSDIYNKVF